MLLRTATAVTGLSVGIFSPISWRYTSSSTGFHNRRGFAFMSAGRGCWAGALGRSTILNQAEAISSLSQKGKRVEDFILASDNVGAMLESFSSQRKKVNPEPMRHDFYASTGTADKSRLVIWDLKGWSWHGI